MLRPELTVPLGDTAVRELTSGTPPGPASQPSGSASVAVIGGGASGTLAAIHLLASRSHDLTITVHEPSGELGRGIAYGTTDARHLLNVRSRHMSAFPEIPSDLVEWAARTGRQPDAQAFLPRRDYAVYLRETLARLADNRLAVCADRVVDLEPLAGGGFRLTGASGDRSTATTVVLAHGNARPAPLTVAGKQLPPADWHVGDPWDTARTAHLASDAVVVVVGSGLTAVDTSITLLGDAPERRVVMVSRAGLLPHGHVEQSSTAWVSPLPDGPVTADVLAEIVSGQFTAARRQGVDWRPVVDGLRAPTQSLWRRLDLVERRRFLALYARQWEIRRHRMATEVADRIAAYREQGRLTLVAGGLTDVVDHGRRCAISSPGLPDPVYADAIVNCTGPRTDVSTSEDPLLSGLVRRGLVVPDPLRLGVDCRPDGEVLDGRGQIVPGLFVIGPPRKGVLWETTAVPEIRAQAATLAARLPQQVRALHRPDDGVSGRRATRR